MPEMPNSSLLCSDTARDLITDPNPIQISKLDLWITAVWLRKNGYEDLAYRIQACGTSFVHLRCSNGHEKFTRLHCKQDYCPKCGQMWSGPHKRRATRAMDRLIWGPVVGYMVYTLPEEVSAQWPDKDALNYLSKKAWEITRRYFNTDGGMVRTHFMGEKSEKLHIHFNVLFPNRKINSMGKVPIETLKAVRQEWTNVVNGYFELGHKRLNSFYNFVWEYGKRIHRVKYVMRPIITTKKFLRLSEEDKHYVLSLKGWKNTRFYGKLANCQYKQYLRSQGVNPTRHEDEDIGLSRRCPICKEKFKFVDVVHKDALPRLDLRYADKDTLVDLAIWSYLNNNDP